MISKVVFCNYVGFFKEVVVIFVLKLVFEKKFCEVILLILVKNKFLWCKFLLIMIIFFGLKVLIIFWILYFKYLFILFISFVVILFLVWVFFVILLKWKFFNFDVG